MVRELGHLFCSHKQLIAALFLCFRVGCIGVNLEFLLMISSPTIQGVVGRLAQDCWAQAISAVGGTFEDIILGSGVVPSTTQKRAGQHLAPRTVFCQ